jgi:hypothetical protein
MEGLDAGQKYEEEGTAFAAAAYQPDVQQI